MTESKSSCQYRNIFHEDKSVSDIVSGVEYKTMMKFVKSKPHIVTETLQKYNPNVLFVFTRSLNSNVLVVDFDSQTNTPHIYWLLLEPSYIMARRSKNIQHDYEDMTVLERNFYWKFSLEQLSNNRHRLVFHKLRKVKFVIESNKKVKCEISNGRAIHDFKGVYLQLGKTVLGFDTVHELKLFGKGSQSTSITP